MIFSLEFKIITSRQVGEVIIAPLGKFCTILEMTAETEGRCRVTFYQINLTNQLDVLKFIFSVDTYI